MTQEELDQMFVDKYANETDGSFLYETKNGTSRLGEVVGMVTTPSLCKGTAYNYPKDTTVKYTQIGSFIMQDGLRESDLQVPFCNNCN